MCGHEPTMPSAESHDSDQKHALCKVEVDFLCDRTVEFIGSGDLLNIVTVELAEKSVYFERLLRHQYHTDKGAIQLPEFLKVEFLNILEFIRTGSVNITESNVYDLLIAADFLLITNLKAECITFITKMITKPREAIKVWISCQNLFWSELSDMALDSILENFELVSKSAEFLRLTFQDVKKILINDGLNCYHERNVIDAISLWYNHDKAHRREYLEDLCMCIRIGLLSEGDKQYYTTSSLAKSSPYIAAILESWPMCLLDTSKELISKHGLQLLKPRIPNEIMMVFGGWCDGEGPRATAQVYDPNANQWTLWTPETRENNLLGEIPRRVYAGCVIVDKCVYLVGGFDGQNALKSTLCYNFETDSGWFEISCMYEKRYYVAITHANKFIYALGGHNGENHGRLSTTERYNIAENLWNKISPMNRVRSDAAAAELGDQVYVCGGFNGRQYHASSEYYTAETNQWTLISPMISPRGGVTLASHNSMLYAIGGNDGNTRLRTIEKYDPAVARWEMVSNMSRRKSNLSCSVVKDDIYIIGGWSDEQDTGILDEVEKFNTQTSQCEKVQELCFPASATCASTLMGKNLVVKYITRENDENKTFLTSISNSLTSCSSRDISTLLAKDLSQIAESSTLVDSIPEMISDLTAQRSPFTNQHLPQGPH